METDAGAQNPTSWNLGAISSRLNSLQDFIKAKKNVSARNVDQTCDLLTSFFLPVFYDPKTAKGKTSSRTISSLRALIDSHSTDSLCS